MNKLLLTSTLAIMLFSNTVSSAPIPDFINLNDTTYTESNLASLSDPDVKVTPNPDKWIYYTTLDKFDIWYSPESIFVLSNSDKETVKVKIIFYQPKEKRYYIDKRIYNYTDNYYVRLHADGYNLTTGIKEWESTNQHWKGTKYPIIKNGKYIKDAAFFKKFLDDPNYNKWNNVNNSNNPKNALSQSSILPGHVYIPARTKLKVELLDRMDCKKSKLNEIVSFKTIENLIINGTVVIPAGTIGKGQIYDVQSPGGFGRKGVVRMKAKEIRTVNNVPIPLINGLGGQGSSDGGAVAVAAAVTLIGGIFMKGSGVAFEPGTNFVVEVKQDTDLGVTFEQLPEAMNPSIPHGVEIILPVK